MSEIFVVSDTHFGHQKIFEETPELYGHFKDIDERDEYLIKVWNETVSDLDTVFHLGDVAFNSRVPLLGRLNGRKKILIMGNHEHKNISQYLPYFKDIKACVVYHDVLLTHIPVHPSQFARFRANIHGHTHQTVIDDPRYINVCIEHTNLRPVRLIDILERVPDAA